MARFPLNYYFGSRSTEGTEFLSTQTSRYPTAATISRRMVAASICPPLSGRKLLSSTYATAPNTAINSKASHLAAVLRDRRNTMAIGHASTLPCPHLGVSGHRPDGACVVRTVDALAGCLLSRVAVERTGSGSRGRARAALNPPHHRLPVPVRPAAPLLRFVFSCSGPATAEPFCLKSGQEKRPGQARPDKFLGEDA